MTQDDGQSDKFFDAFSNLPKERLEELFERVASRFAPTFVIHNYGSVYLDAERSSMNQNIQGSQIGAVSGTGNATAKENSFVQSLQQSGVGDASALLEELELLQTEMQKKATTREHNKAITSIGNAIDAVEGKKSEGVFTSLKKAGNWALEIAKGIGVKVASDAIERSLGMKGS